MSTAATLQPCHVHLAGRKGVAQQQALVSIYAVAHVSCWVWPGSRIRSVQCTVGSTYHCSIMADMLVHTSISTSYPAVHLHFLGLLCYSNLQMACRSLRQQRSAGLIFVENVVQCVNLTFYTMPNVYLNQRPCNITDPFLFWCAWVRWTCWNTVGYLTLSNCRSKMTASICNGMFAVTTEDVPAVVNQCSVAG